MIRENNAQAAIDAAVEFDKRGLGLTFKSSSLLEALVASSCVDFKVPTNVAAGHGYEPDAATISFVSQIKPMGMDVAPHDAALDRAVVDVSDAVRGHVFVYKNTVRPLIKEFFDRVEAAIKAQPAEATFNPNVVRVSLPAPMQSNLFQGLVDEYTNTPYHVISGSANLPPIDAEAALALLPLGNSAVDNDIAAWAATVGPDFLVEVYNGVFGNAGATLSVRINNALTGVDAALAAFLFGKKLIDNVPEGVNMSLSDYRIAIGDVIAQSGLRLTQAYKDFAGYEKVGHMVLSSTPEAVRVVAPVYDAWLEAGNNVAALFGSILSERPANSAEGLSNNSADFVATWERHNRNLTTTLNSRRFVDTVALLKFKTAQLVAERVKDCFGTLDESPELNFDSPCVRAAQQRWEAIIDSFTADDLKNLWKVAISVIAGGVFYYTDALKFIECVERLAEENPSLPVSEAVLMAVAELVVDYIADQITVFDL